MKCDRRRFLLGAGGALLALPTLEIFTPRRAFAQAAAPPKRLLVFAHGHGRIVGNGSMNNGALQDLWSPGATTGPLPASGPASPLLAPLAPIRDEIVTIDGVDNLMRHATGNLPTENSDGHFSAARTFLTCQIPNADGSGTGPSIDYVAGLQLRANGSMLPSMVFPADSANNDSENITQMFFGAGGSPPQLAHVNPIAAAAQTFASLAPTSAASPLLQRLIAGRMNILDAVNKDFSALRTQLNTADRARLDAHAQFIQTLQSTYASGTATGQPVQGCAPPQASAMPNVFNLTLERGQGNAVTTPLQIENAIQALACDVTRVVSLHFWNNSDPVFPSMFSGASPFMAANWHQSIHETPSLTPGAKPQPGASDLGSDPADLSNAFQFYAQMFTHTVQRLAAIKDTDGSRMLDNTLVLWISDMGYGAAHYDWNLPVVMAGMKSAFVQGQGRHLVVQNRATLGDLYAQVLRMLGGSATTFGATGTLGSVTGNPSGDAGFFMTPTSYDNSATASSPLHTQALDL